MARILPDGTRKRATLFSGFLSHYLIRDRYGRPGKGYEEGARSEGLLLGVYSTPRVGAPRWPRFATGKDFNAWLKAGRRQC